MRRVSEWFARVVGGRRTGSEQATLEAQEGASGAKGANSPGRHPSSYVGSVPGSQPSVERAKAFAGSFLTGWKTDTGMVRDHNEDGLFVFTGFQDACQAAPAFGLFMVADGMGGHCDGEAASSLALRISASRLIEQVYVPLLSGPDRGADQPSLVDVVHDAIVRANKVVAHSYPGSGSTLTYGMVLGHRLFVGHVGDSRAYLLRTGETPQRLTRDHSLVGRLVEMGQISEAEALVHPQRNVLYRAIGQPENLEPEVATWSLQSGDRLLLCSDGLWNSVEESEIWRIVDGGGDPQQACEALISAANTAGGYDNITVVLAEVRLTP